MTKITYDIAVIGGGVNGAGIARDAAGRGARVLLLEAHDLASGTSSASTKLIHGGLRYLEHYEFALVRESLSERERLWAIAPHIIGPMRFVLPYRPGLRPRWMLRAGLFLYDHIGGRKKLPATRTISLSRHPAGAPLQPQYATAFEYSDGWVDDARLVVLNARDAADRGAEIHTRCAVTRLERSDDAWTIGTDHGGTFQAHAIVNAAGPAVLDVLARTDEPSAYQMRLVRGSHIVVRKLFDHPFAYFFQLPDGRIFFAIPYEQDFTLIGTTDVDHHGSLTDLRASDAEIAYLCDGANDYFQQQITPADVIWSYSGVRPLIDDGSGKPEAATRGYRLDLSDDSDGAPILSVFGGKITTYRHLAEEAIDMLMPRVLALRGSGWTGSTPLPGGDFPIHGRADLARAIKNNHAFLPNDVAARYARTYGTRSMALLDGAGTMADMGQYFGHGLFAREVDWLIVQEWAQTSDDILWRRTKLGLRFNATETAMLSAYLTDQMPPATGR